MKKLFKTSWALLLSFALVLALAAMPVYAAADPAVGVEFIPSWDTAKTTLTLTCKIKNPNNTFYSGAVALDYDKTLFEFVKAEKIDPFSIVKNADDKDGHVLTDFAYFGDNSNGNGGLAPSTTATEAYTLEFKLKSGQTYQNVKSKSITISDDDDYLKELKDPYKGAVTLYCSKSSTDADPISFSLDDATNVASGSVNNLIDDVSVESISIDPKEATIHVGETKQITATVSPSNATNKSVKWSSSDASIASVDPDTGIVTGVSVGTATITATSVADGSIVASASITVKAKEIKEIEEVKVSTTTGTAPTLPQKVKVTYADGTTAELPVTWETIPASSYASAGSFTVKGTVAGQSITALVTVTDPPKSDGGGGGNANGGSNSPGTGDNVSAIVITSALLIISIIAIIAVILSKKKNSGNGNGQ